MNRIGLLGGSFDPPHKGHLTISLEAKKIFSLKEVWWLVTPKNPLKIKKPATYKERIYNCNEIIKNQPIKIKEYENNINSNYSYKTVSYLNNKFKFYKFFWLMGADNLIHFHKWQKWEKIFHEVSIVVFRRHSYNGQAMNSLARKKYFNYHINPNRLDYSLFSKLPSWTYLKNKEIKISSTEIRQQRVLLRGKN